MRTVTITAILLAALSANLCLAGEAAPSAASLFEKGNALLAKGQFREAAATCAAALKADPENEEYKKRALVLQRVVALRKFVSENEPSAKWEKMVASLHGWYLRNDLVAIAVEADRKAFAKSQSATVTTILAESLIEKGEDAEVVTLLAEVPEERRHEAQPLFLGIAHARLGHKDQAARIAQETALADDPGTGILYTRARLEALLGNGDRAVELLTLCMEKTPVRGMEDARRGIRECADFAGLDKEAVAKVMATESKVDESGCSGASGCGSCPKREGCGK